MALSGTLGFLGFGNMGGAILQGLLGAGTTTADRVAVYDVLEEKCAAGAALGAAVAASPEALAQACDTLVVAVKPQNMAEALDQMKPGFEPKTLIVTIAAGISIGYIQERLGGEARVVRVMPNTPALVNAGAAGIAVSDNCSGDDAATACTIFEAVGIAETVPEALIDVVTALSGSGPAYFFCLVECLARAAAAHGMDEAQATRLAVQTALGAGRLMAESGESPVVLRERVTSKGGTTAAALESFCADGFDRVIAAGVDAAVARAKELGQ